MYKKRTISYFLIIILSLYTILLQSMHQDNKNNKNNKRDLFQKALDYYNKNSKFILGIPVIISMGCIGIKKKKLISENPFSIFSLISTSSLLTYIITTEPMREKKQEKPMGQEEQVDIEILDAINNELSSFLYHPKPTDDLNIVDQYKTWYNIVYPSNCAINLKDEQLHLTDYLNFRHIVALIYLKTFITTHNNKTNWNKLQKGFLLNNFTPNKELLEIYIKEIINIHKIGKFNNYCYNLLETLALYKASQKNTN